MPDDAVFHYEDIKIAPNLKPQLHPCIAEVFHPEERGNAVPDGVGGAKAEGVLMEHALICDKRVFAGTACPCREPDDVRHVIGHILANDLGDGHHGTSGNHK